MTYLAFLAPGLLAATAMQTASFEATFPIMGGLRWNRIFHAMFATPIRPRDVALGQPRLDRGPADARRDDLRGRDRRCSARPRRRCIVLAIPAAVLTGLAFAAPIMAFTATQRTPDKFAALFRFGITPLFLFSGTFFPIEQLPSSIRSRSPGCRRCGTASR